ncbi:hypothetical protein ACFQ48_19420 [Hymenobacter caeli]|uniref:Uncharacterized protein n=1 Tax=Hymenobacter caeli TaxID=2735894 RepID=A0ABX2FV99_9BACT|nr:hypothetical protein [Hymenobacter caeli]NRT21130.1 hypothetical protein [Hymenobacter caeli]
MFKPAKIESRRGRIPVSEEARREARAGMGGEQTALAAATPVVPVAPAAPVVGEGAPEPSAPAAEVAPPVVEAAAAPVAPAAVTPAEAPARRLRATKAALAPVVATGPEQEHSVKLSRSVVQQIKLTLALLPSAPDNPANIKQYLEMAHRLLDAQMRKAGKLPPAPSPGV